MAFDSTQVAALQQARRRADAIAAANQMVMSFGRTPLRGPSHVRAGPSRRLPAMTNSGASGFDSDDNASSDGDGEGKEGGDDTLPRVDSKLSIKDASQVADLHSLDGNGAQQGKRSLADGLRHSDSASLSDSDSISDSSDDYDAKEPSPAAENSGGIVEAKPRAQFETVASRVAKAAAASNSSTPNAKSRSGKSVAFAATPEGVRAKRGAKQASSLQD